MAPTTVISGYQQEIGSLADYFLFEKSNKSVSTYKNVIEITTNGKSLLESKKFIDILTEKIIPNLPSKKEDLILDLIHKQLENTKENQLKINKMFDTINTLFDNGEDVSIDDSNMLNFLSNMKKVQVLLSYVYDYLTLILEVNEANLDFEKNAKDYTFEDFTKKLNFAA